MPRPKKEGAPEPKKRSRNGCWPCKARKVKCGEEKPKCLNCERTGETCDYSIRLNWGGRTKKSQDDTASSSGTNSPFSATFPGTIQFPAFEQFGSTGASAVQQSRSQSQPSTSAPMTTGSSLDLPLPVIPSSPGVFQTQCSGQEGGPLPPIQRPGGASNLPVDPRIQGVQALCGTEYPSSPVSSVESSNPSNSVGPTGEHAVAAPLSPMLPPMRANPMYSSTVAATSPQHRTKRLRLSPQYDSFAPHSMQGGSRQNYAVETPNAGMVGADAPSPYSTLPMTPYSPFVSTPLTPGSSVASEESSLKSGTRSLPTGYQILPESKRLSVNDLLIDNNHAGSGAQERSSHYPSSDVRSGTTTYGYDIGRPDLDIPKNDDDGAIAMFSPPASYGGINDFGSEDEPQGRHKSIAFEADGYYAKPVPIKIPKSFEPLPPRLLENPMNLLYFHHFLNHTARILVPHDCERNPFRSVLPQLAVHDDDLLGLLLAFSASHRARLLCHKEPSNRIAVWVQDVFPKLRHALTSNEQISNANLTTAIMLASLEIISPNAFEVPVSWQNHLTVARQMIIARGGLQSLNRKDQVAYFLSRWFAYLDVLGSLSGSKDDLPLNASYLALSDDENNTLEEDVIDCLLGFTSRFIGTLARIAELAKQCETQRIDAGGNVREDWSPPPDVVSAAEKLRIELRQGRENVVQGCTHGGGGDYDDDSSDRATWDSAEIYATNSAFHWAGLLHLLRRVLGRPAADAEVQTCVAEILDALSRVRRGGSAEACLLFPMFSAGCDALEPGQRAEILERLKGLESVGLAQGHRAVEVVERVWRSGKPWEMEVKGEFFG